MNKLIIASGPVIVEEGRVLLNQHGDTTFWKFCGGKVENFEASLIDTARREANEEMGIDLEIVSRDPFLLHTTKEKDGILFDVILVHYLATRIGEIMPGLDIRAWAWIPLQELHDYELAPNILPTLKHFNLLT